ncbi:MAG: rhomboid family intramembrane serine protease [Bacteroidota bacterium]
MSITIVLIVFTVLISLQVMNRPDLKAKLVFHPGLIQERGEWYRFLTSGFIHADGRHLFFNMLGLYIFGRTAETLFVTGGGYYDSRGGITMIEPIFGPSLGPVMYLAFYMAAIIAASSVNYIRHKDNFAFSALGASGGVSALIWPYIFFAPWEWFIFPPLPAIVIGPLYLWYSSRMDRDGRDRVDHSAHLWGAIFGLICYVLLIIFRRPELFTRFWTALMQPQGPSFLGF